MNLFASPNTDDFTDPFQAINLSSQGDLKEEIDLFSSQIVLKDLSTEFDIYLKQYPNVFHHEYFEKFLDFIANCQYSVSSFFFLLKEYDLFDMLASNLNKQDPIPEELKEIVQDMIYFSCVQFLRTHRKENRIKILSFQTCCVHRSVEILIDFFQQKKKDYLWEVLTSDLYKKAGFPLKMLLMSMVQVYTYNL